MEAERIAHSLDAVELAGPSQDIAWIVRGEVESGELLALSVGQLEYSSMGLTTATIDLDRSRAAVICV